MVNPATKHPDKGGISTTVAIVDSWCHELLLRIEKLEKTVVLLENENKNQKETINELKKRLGESSVSGNGAGDEVEGGRVAIAISSNIPVCLTNPTARTMRPRNALRLKWLR